MGLLQGKTALVTGAARGIGFGIAAAFAREGAKVAMVDRNLPEILKAAAVIGQRDGVTFGLAADVGDEGEVQAAISTAQERFDGIDILVNNAGIDTTASVTHMPTQMWDEMMRVNVRSVFLCCRAVLPGMIKRKYGRIINISSQLAHKGTPEMAHYCASKAAVLGFTRSLAYEVIGDAITVNAICPGPVDTIMFRSQPDEWQKRKLAELPIGRMGTVEEIVPTAVLLASEGGSFYVGASLNPNGGDVMM